MSHLQLVSDDYFDEDLDQDPPVKPLGGFEPLGIERDRVAIFSELQKSVLRLRPRDLSEVNLRLQLGSTWYDECDAWLEASERKGRRKSSGNRVGKHVIRSCQAAGVYTPTAERGAGAWLDVDGGLVINGESLWRHDGTVLSHGRYGAHIYPVARPLGFGPETSPAGAAEVQHVLHALRSFNWAVPHAAELVLGWVGVCLVATALRRRPHLLVTGPHGCGKSTLLEQVACLLGIKAARVTGRPTLIGLQQLLQDHPGRAIIIDEFESDGRGSRRKDVLEAARSSYSLQEGDAGVVRGSATGEAKSYRLSSPFMACGIAPDTMEPADVSRWCVLELGRLKDRASGGDGLPSHDEFKHLGAGLARRFVCHWPAFDTNLCTYRSAIQNGGGDARMADTYGHLLASYSTFLSGEPVTLQDAAQLVADTGITGRALAKATHDEQECMSALFTRVTGFSAGDGAAMKLAIGEAVRWVVEAKAGMRAIEDRLTQLGLRVRRSKQNGLWYLLVANSQNHQELRRLFAGTKWSQGSWGPTLRRLPGGHESTQRLGPGAEPSKVTAFQLPEGFQPAGTEGGVAIA